MSVFDISANMLKTVITPTPEKSMEDVWKDLSAVAAVSPAVSAAGDRAVFQGLSLSDFLLVERDTPTTVLRLNPERPSSLPLSRSASPPPNGSSDQLKKKRGRLENGEDVRFKRMVKNRESAARSRARRQAYTYELELEIAHLQKENAMLKKQLQKKDLCLAKEAPAVQLLKKPSLQRTLTSPF